MKSKYYIPILTSLLLIFLASPFLMVVQKEIKKEIRIKILKKSFKEDELVKFELKDLQQASWESTDEFFYKGDMYDVVYFKVIADVEYVFCIKDQKESIIHPLKQIAELFKKKHKEIYLSKSHHLQKNHTQFLILSLQETIVLNANFYPKEVHIYKEQNKSVSFLVSIFSPPEKIIVYTELC